MLKPALTLMAGRTLGYAVLFLLPIILVRLFTQEQFGTYKQVFLLYGTILNLAQVGMSESLFYFLPGASEDAGRYVCNSMLVLGGIGALTGGVLYAGGDVIAHYMNNPALEPLMPLLALFFMLMLASYVLEIVMTARHQYTQAAAAYGLSDVARAALVVLPALVFQTVASVLYGAIVHAVLRLGTTLWYCRKQFGASLRPDRPLLLRQIAYSLPFALYVLFHTGQESLHLFVVSSWFDAMTFAVYSVGCLQIPLAEVVSASVVNVMMVGMVQAIREGREAAVIPMWHDTVRKLALIFFPFVAVLFITAHDLILFLFTDAYAASVPVFRVWSLIVLFSVIPMDGLLRVYAQTPFLLYINIVKLALVGGTIYWSVAEWGLIGAVAVTLVALAAGKAIGLVRMIHCGLLNARNVLPWRSLAEIGFVAGAASIPAWWITGQLSAPHLGRLVVASATYGAAYVSLALICGVIRKNEQDRVLRWLEPAWRPMRLKALFMR
jgi:O-antigen/teichoic acid export membrane protein